MDGTETIGIILVIGVMIGIPLTMYSIENIPADAVEDIQVVEITAWTVENGGWTPNEIIVKKDIPVRLVIRSADITHVLYIPDLDIIGHPISAGHVDIVEFTPTETGTFPFQCDLYCSELHQEMMGILIVED